MTHNKNLSQACDKRVEFTYFDAVDMLTHIIYDRFILFILPNVDEDLLCHFMFNLHRQKNVLLWINKNRIGQNEMKNCICAATNCPIWKNRREIVFLFSINEFICSAVKSDFFIYLS